MPAADIYEDRDKITVRAELPGMNKEDIDISLHEGVLSISGERKDAEELADAEVCRAERFVGRFQRAFTLNAPVNSDQVSAAYKNGILTVTLPKKEEAKPRQIEVSVK
jgi:HSP20 family protein